MPSQWETALLCNDVSRWLGTSLESALIDNLVKYKPSEAGGVGGSSNNGGGGGGGGSKRDDDDNEV